MITCHELKKYLKYDQNTGIFVWIARPSVTGRFKVGKHAGWISQGRLRIAIHGTTYLASRLAWLYVKGAWPRNCIDHINGNKKDNRFSNLRDVGHAINMENRRRCARNNRAKMLGVTKLKNKFQAGIVVRKKFYYLGVHDTAIKAHKAYLHAKRKYHVGCTI